MHLAGALLTIAGVKKLLSTSALASLLCSLLLAFGPVAVYAEETPTESSLAPVLITEIQPGSGASASEEFIEIYNTTEVPIDLAAYEWRLEIASSTATSWDSPYRVVALEGLLEPGQSLVVASQFSRSGEQVQYLPDLASAWFSAGLAATGGHVRLTYTTLQLQDGVCTPSPSVVDQVEWSVPVNGQPSMPSLDGRAVFVTASGGVAKTASLQRQIDQAAPQAYLDTNNDTVDLATGEPSPGAVNSLSATATNPVIQPPVPLPTDGCDPTPPPDDVPPSEPPESPGSDEESAGGEAPPDTPAPTTPPANSGAITPVISELLPNPAPPQSDDTDEFIELYNPGDTTFDLEGYMLEVGLTTKRRYTFPAGTSLAPQTYLAFFVKDTKLSLTNSGGQARLLDPEGLVLDETDAYGVAKDGQAWTLVDGLWQWTISVTPAAQNVVASPAVKPAKTTAAKPKTAAKKTAAQSKKVAAKKTSKPKKEKKQKLETEQAATVSSTDHKAMFMPLHPGVLAAAALFAVLYGAYEYRGDLANKFHQFRTNRAARREARRVAEGRRSH